MKYVLGLLLGFVIGAACALALLLWNPMFDNSRESRLGNANLELPISGEGAVTVSRSVTGYPWLSAQPANAESPAVEGVTSAVSISQVTTGIPGSAAYVVRLQSLTDDGKPLFGELLEQSLFYIVLPELGSMIVASDDDLWGFARQLAVPLVRGEEWRGNIRYRSTIGPERGYAEVHGIGGDIRGLTGRAELMQSVRRASLSGGIIDGDSRISVSLALPATDPAVASNER